MPHPPLINYYLPSLPCSPSPHVHSSLSTVMAALCLLPHETDLITLLDNPAISLGVFCVVLLPCPSLPYSPREEKRKRRENKL